MAAPPIAEPVWLEPGLRRVLAPNPSPMTAEGTNTYILGEGSVVLIDPGPALPAHASAIRAALSPDERVSHIVVTHAHLDHSPLARRLADEWGLPVLGFGPPEAGRSPLMAALAAQGHAGGGEGVDAAFAPDVCLGDGDRIEGAGWALQALHTPGHFAGHLCFAWGDRLFSGDHVMAWAPSLVSPPDGEMGAYMASLRRLALMGFTRAYPGHGAPVDEPTTRITALIAHREGREAAILAALDAGDETLAAITARVYADTAAALLPAAARNAFAHLIDLCDRGLVTASPTLNPSALFSR